ncbi:MAG: F0F1 ATP synthase subunit A [Candidatus Hydrogenedentes bacterium]|nr:F0F1 ATP synthase subunit A [Candidatus Hydrogenedentota bacterium]
MESIGERLIWYYFPFTDIEIPGGGINVLTVLNTIFVMGMLWTLMWLAMRRLTRVPGRSQVVIEQFITAFDGLVSSSLELPTRKENRLFLPLIASLFVFLLLSNFMGFLPTNLFEEPTADINCTLSLGLMAVVIATYCGIKAKGLGGYFNEFMGPLWSQEGATGMELITNKASFLFFLPLNVISEMAKVVSISFRLFGNIIGGSIIIVVVSTLVANVVVPVGLDLFFIFFVGTVQAFVFTMLTLTYIAVAIK